MNTKWSWVSLLRCVVLNSWHKHGVHSAPPKAEATLSFMQIGLHHPIDPVHEQHGVNLAKNVEEANPLIIVYGLL